jgi:beta-lactamase regulating signal transducer with metallopeptidase domain/thiol-disulfide isomerase/thioredoxin
MFDAILSSRIVEAVGVALVHSLWQGALIALAAAAVLLAMRRCSAAKRYVVAYSALALMVVAPGVTFGWVLPGLQNGAFWEKDLKAEDRGVVTIAQGEQAGMPSAADEAASVQHGGFSRFQSEGGSSLEGTQSAALIEPRPSHVERLTAALRVVAPWAAMLWALGVAVLSFRLAGALLHVKTLKRRGTPASAQCVVLMLELCERMRIRRVVTLLESAAMSTPCVIGWLKPVILLPASALIRLSPEQLEAVLLHELAHIRRHDWLFSLIQQVLETLLFYHPATWWLSRRIRAERELCCDDVVIGITRDRVVYARALTALAFAAQESVLAPAATGGPLLARIQRILGLEPLRPRRRMAGAISAALTATVAALVVVIGYVEAALDPHRLEFPEDRSVGNIMVRPETDTYDWTIAQDKAVSNWEEFGEAKGLVVIPDGKVARLTVKADEKPADLVFLDTLHPDSLAVLDVAKTSISDDALVHVARLTGLKALNLEQTKVTDAGIKSLAPLTQLEWLSLKITEVTGNDAGLENFAKLKHLYFSSNEIRDSALIPLERLADLQVLCLDWSKVTREGLQHLQGLKQLRSLSLDSVPIRDKDFEVLGAIESLQVLNLSETHITDASMAIIKQMPNIKVRSINDTLITGVKGQRQFYGGRVVDEAGKPVAGATAHVYYSILGTPVSHGGETTTDADGRWTYPVPLEYSDLSLSLKHPDFVSDKVSNARPIPSKDSMLDGSAQWVMKKGREVSGHVVGPDGKPVAGAYVLTTIYFGGELEERQKNDRSIVRTDEQGNFRLSNLDETVTTLTIHPAEFAPKVIEIDTAKQTKPIEVAVEPGVNIAGRVVDVRGQPLADVKIEIDEWRLNLQHTIDRNVETDADGNFTLVHMPSEGTLRLDFGRKGYFHASASMQLPVEEALVYELVEQKNLQGRVVDADTGETVGPFTAVLGAKGWYEQNDEIHWFTNFTSAKVDASKGTFVATPHIVVKATTPGTPRQMLLARVHANGYFVTDSELQDIADLGKEVTIRMRKGEPVTGIVHDAKGEPIADAHVIWVESKEKAYIQNGVSNEDFGGTPTLKVSSNKEGVFEFPPHEQPGVLLALHDAGYAWVLSTDQKPNAPLVLTPWSRIEGQVHDANGNVIPIMLTVEQPALLEKTELIQWMFQVSSSADGAFSIDKVPALPLTIGKGERWVTSHGVQITPKAGETAKVDIASGGRRIAGRLDFSRVKDLFDGTTTEMIDARHLFLSFKPKTGAEKPAFEPLYIPDVKEDGSFAVEGLPPAEYIFTAEFHASPPPSACGRGTTVGDVEKAVTVGSGDATKPIDMGTLVFEPVQFPKVGTTAPEITGGDLGTGKDWKLSEERGKYVLLDFWATWCGPCQAAVPKIRSIYQKFGERLVIVGLNLDFKQEDAKKHIETNAMDWKQIYIDEWSDTNRVTSTYGVSYIPSLWLLDPQGNVVYRDIPVDKLEETIAGVLK